MLQEVHNLLDRISRIHLQMRPKRSFENKLLLKSLNNLIEQLSQDQEKKVKFIHDRFRGNDIPHQHQLLIKDILIQLIRNAISHGIENPEERLKLGKAECGSIEVTTFKSNSEFGFNFKDDGRGLRVEKLKERALQSGKWSKKEIDQWDLRHVIETIYTPGISTAEEIDMLSGRGVGMDSVKEKVESHGGSIDVKFEAGKYCEFIVALPD